VEVTFGNAVEEHVLGKISQKGVIWSCPTVPAWDSGHGGNSRGARKPMKGVGDGIVRDLAYALTGYGKRKKQKKKAMRKREVRKRVILPEKRNRLGANKEPPNPYYIEGAEREWAKPHPTLGHSSRYHMRDTLVPS